MDDKDIVALYFDRNERAIDETKAMYGHYCRSIAYNILRDLRDAEECENDTYLSAWSCIPPHKPQVLRTFLGRITRNLSLKKYRDKTADKRGNGETAVAIDELFECIPSATSLYDKMEAKELAQIIDSFLRSVSEEQRNVFILRYWYFHSVNEICEQFGYSRSKVKMLLLRTRNKLAERLKEEGVTL